MKNRRTRVVHLSAYFQRAPGGGIGVLQDRLNGLGRANRMQETCRRGDGFQPLQWSMYVGTWLSAFQE